MNLADGWTAGADWRDRLGDLSGCRGHPGSTETAFVSKQLKLAGCCRLLVRSCLVFFPIIFTREGFHGDGGRWHRLFAGAITVIGTLKTTAVLSIMIPVIVVALR